MRHTATHVVTITVCLLLIGGMFAYIGWMQAYVARWKAPTWRFRRSSIWPSKSQQFLQDFWYLPVVVLLAIAAILAASLCRGARRFLSPLFVEDRRVEAAGITLGGSRRVPGGACPRRRRGPGGLRRSAHLLEMRVSLQLHDRAGQLLRQSVVDLAGNQLPLAVARFQTGASIACVGGRQFGGPLGDSLLQFAVGRLHRRNSRLHFSQFRQQALIALRLCVAARHNGFPSAGSSGTLPWRVSLAKIAPSASS